MIHTITLHVFKFLCYSVLLIWCFIHQIISKFSSVKQEEAWNPGAALLCGSNSGSLTEFQEWLIKAIVNFKFCFQAPLAGFDHFLYSPLFFSPHYSHSLRMTFQHKIINVWHKAINWNLRKGQWDLQLNNNTCIILYQIVFESSYYHVYYTCKWKAR